MAAAVGCGAIGLPLLLAVAGIDFINPRNLLGALVPILIVVAIGLGMPRSGAIGVAGGGAMCAMFAGVLVANNVSAQMQRPDWRGAADAIQASAPNARAIVIPRNGDDPLSYYLGAQELRKGRPNAIRTDVIPVLSTTYAVKPPPGPFHLAAQQRLAPYFILWRYVASHPVRIRLRSLTGRAVLSERSAVLIRTGQ